MIRVVIVDDHPIVRTGIAGLLKLEDDIDVVGSASDGTEALKLLAADDAIDIVLTDLRMPGMDGVATITAIQQAHPDVKVVVLTTYDSDGDIMRAIEAGAAGYMLKDSPQAELVAAVRAAASGQTALSPTVAAKLMQNVQAPSGTKPTSRELEVLALVAEGMKNAEIAERLIIGEATVKTHLMRLFTKLGVDDRTHAVTIAMQRGLLRR